MKDNKLYEWILGTMNPDKRFDERVSVIRQLISDLANDYGEQGLNFIFMVAFIEKGSDDNYFYHQVRGLSGGIHRKKLLELETRLMDGEMAGKPENITGDD